MTQSIHDLLHKLAKLNKARERNSRKFSKVLTQLIIEVESMGQTETQIETQGGSDADIAKETDSVVTY